MMENSKKKNIKIYAIFFGAMAICLIAGLCCGYIIAKIKKAGNFEDGIAALKGYLIQILPVGYAGVVGILLLVLLGFFLSCKRMYKKLEQKAGGENAESDWEDELLDALEQKLNYPAILANSLIILSVFSLGWLVYLREILEYGQHGAEKAILIINIVLMLLSDIAGMLVMHGCVKIEKKLNPEKEGNIFDLRFNAVWHGSCDEAQKMMVYQAAYQAFKNTNTICEILCMISFIGIFLFDTGIYPLICICVIWFVNLISYMIKAAKLEKTN